ncbi:hypothetical protein AOQ84DRAFT_370028 [Glonium stellatum]|uniref:Peptidase S54 rhomboid domain-containing protein n=1 Tax=Glonium stellatum TaxID=574774 RepID=A0A8E2EMN3_9PEZI|nr:hypothetical protein AOQ84DRAFT_370028 [Glonium stellatum]
MLQAARIDFGPAQSTSVQICYDPFNVYHLQFQRLWPTTLFTLAVISLCAWYASTYVPPEHAVRFMKDYTPSLATALTIFSINFGFWLMWAWPRAWPLMNKYMTMTPAYPRAFAALGNVFSHQSIKHLAVNMMYLMTIGVWCHDTVGRGTFLATYIAAGTFGSLSSLWYYTLTRNLTSSSIGASGAMLGILSLWCITENRDRLTIPFTSISIPISPRMFLCIAIIGEIFMMRAGKTPTVDHVSHLGGYAAGIVSGLVWKYGDRWKNKERSQDVMERIEEKVDGEKR